MSVACLYAELGVCFMRLKIPSTHHSFQYMHVIATETTDTNRKNAIIVHHATHTTHTLNSLDLSIPLF